MTEMSNEQLIEFIRAETMESGDVCDFLGVSRTRLQQLVRDGHLTPIRRGIFLRRQVEDRAKEQEILRRKFAPFAYREEEEERNE